MEGKTKNAITTTSWTSGWTRGRS